MESQTQLLAWLRDEYCLRRQKNPQYSLRSYAKKLGTSPGTLSEIFAGKRPVTSKNARRFAQQLGLSYEAMTRIIAWSQPIKKNQARAAAVSENYLQLNEDSFAVIADWQHYAILSLLKTKEFKNDSKWIGKRLGLSTIEVDAAMERLLRLKLIVEVNGKLVRTEHRLATSQDISSAALKRSHKQSLEQAIAALDEVPVELRDISGVTLALNPRKLTQAKELLKNFRRSFLELMESGEKSEVYNLELCLVPLTKIREMK